MDNSLIKINKEELCSTSDYTKELQEQNRKISELRKQHLFDSLKEATTMRIKTAKNIQDWQQLLSDKIFNPQTIADMDLNKAISLFKYVNNLNLKVLADSNRLEEILGKYLQSGAMDMQMEMQENNQSEREKIKIDIMNKLQQMFKNTMSNDEVSDGIIVHPETKDEDIKLVDDAVKSIDENLDELNESTDELDGLINQEPETEEKNSDSEDDDGLIELDLDDEF